MRLGYVGTINGNVNAKAMDVFNGVIPREVKLDIHTKTYEKKMYDGEFFYIVPTSEGNEVYKKLPNVVDDDLFMWTSRKLVNRRKNLWASIFSGHLAFYMTYYLDSDTCQLRIRKRNGCYLDPNTVIWIERVTSNQDILDKINEFITEYKAAVSELVTI